MAGKSIGLYGDTGAGKTTLIGELALDIWKRKRLKTLYKNSDGGGADAIREYIEEGFIIEDVLQGDGIWSWSDRVVSEKLPADIGLVAFDSGTSMSEKLMAAVAGKDIGGRPAPKWNVKEEGKTHTIASNSDSHYGTVQTHMMGVIMKSTWLTREPSQPDILWTFGTHRGETVDNDPMVGPKLAGKALTPFLAKHFNYFFRTVVTAGAAGADETHTLILKPQVGANGVTISIANARYPLKARTPLPASITPASLAEAFRLIAQGHAEAKEVLREELEQMV